MGEHALGRLACGLGSRQRSQAGSGGIGDVVEIGGILNSQDQTRFLPDALPGACYVPLTDRFGRHAWIVPKAIRRLTSSPGGTCLWHAAFRSRS
jgi:hypothetical protein